MHYFFKQLISVITFARGRYVAFWNEASWMLRAAMCDSSVVWSGSGRWGSPIRVSEQHWEGLTQKSHKTFNIIQSLLSHACLDNVTFKTRECRSRKYISGKGFFFLNVGGRKKVYCHQLSCKEESQTAYSTFRVAFIKNKS